MPRTQMHRSDIEALRQEAAISGDARVVAMCDRALAGSERAFQAASKLIRANRHDRVQKQMVETATRQLALKLED